MASTSENSATAPAFDIFADYKGDPYSHYDRLRSTQPVYWEPALRIWVLSRYQDVRALLHDDTVENSDVSQPIAEIARKANRDYAPLVKFLENILFFRNGERHKRDRRSLSQVFTRIPLSEIEPIVDSLARSLASELAARASFDAVRHYADMVPGLVMSHILGLPTAEVRPLLDLSVDVTRAFDVVPVSLLDRLNRQAAAGLDRMAKTIAGAIAAGSENGLTLIYQAAPFEGERKLAEAAALALFTFMVGSETTSSLIGACIERLLKEPDLYARAQAEPSLAGAIAAEVARLESPVQWVIRIATRSHTVGGQEIKPGEHMLLMLGAANRDPSAFARPDELDLQRSEVETVAFGAGKHFCLGTSLARLESRIALEHFLRLPHPMQMAAPGTWYAGRTIHRLINLPVQRAALQRTGD
jgi:cytochrome P450